MERHGRDAQHNFVWFLVVHVLQLVAGRQQRFLEGKISARVGMVSVRGVKQGTRQSASSTAGWVRKSKRTHIGDCALTNDRIEKQEQVTDDMRGVFEHQMDKIFLAFA